MCAQEPIYAKKPPKVAPISSCILTAPCFRLLPVPTGVEATSKTEPPIGLITAAVILWLA